MGVLHGLLGAGVAAHLPLAQTLAGILGDRDHRCRRGEGAGLAGSLHGLHGFLLLALLLLLLLGLLLTLLTLLLASLASGAVVVVGSAARGRDLLHASTALVEPDSRLQPLVAPFFL